MKKTLPYEHVYFNIALCAKMTEAEFLKHEAHHGLNTEQLKEAYKLIKQAAAQEKAPATKE